MSASPPAVAGLPVRIEGVRRSFGEQVVLEGLDLTVRPGEFVALLGRSGTGKSTLLRALGGFDRDVEGRFEVARRRAVVFQEPRLLPWKRVLPNVTLGLRTNDRINLGMNALTEVGLAAKAKAWPVTLSGGEAQRVALARALVREPDLVLLDEPFGALDALTRIKAQELLAELRSKHRPAVLLVTHDVDEAIFLADRILILSEGGFALDATVDIPAPRSRSSLEFGKLRAQLLAGLGVDA